MNVTKLLVGLGLGAGVYAGFNYFRKMNATNKYLEIIPSAQLHKVNLFGLFIRMGQPHWRPFTKFFYNGIWQTKNGQELFMY